MHPIFASFVIASGFTVVVILGHFIVGVMAKAMGWFAAILLLLLFFVFTSSIIIGLIQGEK